MEETKTSGVITWIIQKKEAGRKACHAARAISGHAGPG